MQFNQIVKDIKSLKIQGAVGVAKYSLLAMRDVLYRSKAKTSEKLNQELFKARDTLTKTRPTEPCMRNALSYALSGVHDGMTLSELKQMMSMNIEATQQHFAMADEKIRQYGAKKVTNDMAIYTHCHSSTVVGILKTAKNQGRRFGVRNTETRPMFQGRITAKELAGMSIPVAHYVDSAARYAIRKSDLVLLGVDAVTSEGSVVNKIGTHIMVNLANQYDVPVYFCTDSWKFDPATIHGAPEEIEIRDSAEVWPKSPKGVSVRNYAFELVEANMITGIISELGVFKPGVFIQEIKDTYPWMFN